jgi:4-hydroxythreonine-4-phosphate dehydrogenase
VAVLAAARSKAARCVLFGDEAVIRRAAALRRVASRRLVLLRDERAIASLEPGAIGVWTQSTQMRALPEYGRPSREAGAAQLAWINEGARLVRSGAAGALVTGPASKLAIATSGAPGSAGFLGHTEHLASRLKAREVVMAFWSPELCTSLVTTHIPLAEVPSAITPEGVGRSAYWFARLLHDLGAARPKLAVAALNPHAGEGGLLGKEEGERIAPGIRIARRRLARAGVPAELHGPLGAETAFRLAAGGGYDGVVAMYHDQATIPSKLLGFGEAVNVTLGLPIIRTSVDHGTAYDVAGTGRADARAMGAAIDLAVRLTEARGGQR